MLLKNTPEDIGKRIKEEREARKLTQEDLGKKINMEKSAISKIEHGNYSLKNPKPIYDIAEVLEVKPEYLLGIDPLPTDEDHFIRYIMEHFRICTTEENTTGEIYKDEVDFLLTQKGDNLVLSASQRFFAAIKAISEARNFRADTEEYKQKIAHAKRLLKFNVNSPRGESSYFLISAQQMAQMLNKAIEAKQIQEEREKEWNEKELET